MSNTRRVALAIIVFALAAALRLWIGTGNLEMTFDTGVYVTVADNIQSRGCVSADAGSCAPHWGGNQLPGYPAFLALARATLSLAGIEGSFIAPPVWRGIAVLQSLVTGAACAWLALGAMAWRRSWLFGLAVGTVVAVSPVTLAWPRFLLTECLATATTIFVLAELLFSLAEQRLRWLRLGIGLAAAVFVRYDSVVLALPVCAVAMALAPRRRAVLGLTLAALVAAVPLGGWWVRSVAAGLPPVPNVMMAPQGWHQPVGIFRWMKTWMTDEPEVVMFWWPVLMGDYTRIRLFPEHFDEAEKARVGPLLGELSLHAGREVPPAIDAAFARLAEQRTAAAPLKVRLGLPLERAAVLWTAPANVLNHGWPRPPARLSIGGEAARLWLLAGLGLAILAAGIAWHRRDRTALAIAGGAVLAALGKSLMLGFIGAAEPRYLVELAPLLEVAGLVGAATLSASGKIRRQT